MSFFSKLTKLKPVADAGIKIMKSEEVANAMGKSQPASAEPVPEDLGEWQPPSDGVKCRVYGVQVNYWPYHTALQVDVDSNNDGTFDDNEKLTYEVTNDDKGVAILLLNTFYPDNKIKQRFEAMTIVDSPRGIFDTLLAAATAHKAAYDLVKNNCRDVCRYALDHLRVHYRDRTTQAADAVIKMVEISKSIADVAPKAGYTAANLASDGLVSKTYSFAVDKYEKLGKAGMMSSFSKPYLFRVDVIDNDRAQASDSVQISESAKF